MPTPPKPFTVLSSEGKSHRTKAELEQRKQEEQALTTGVHMKEWDEVKADQVAHKEFQRVRKLLEKIGKDDSLFEGAVNRYATLRAECFDFETRKTEVQNDADELRRKYTDHEIEFLDYMAAKDKLNNVVLALDRQIQAKRKMLLDIEKENIMTIASALRSIPKKVEKAEKKSGFAAYREKWNDAQ